MARPRKPTELKSKHLTEEEIQTDELIGIEAKKVTKDKFKTPPRWLDREAKTEYRRLISVLSGLEYLTDADINNLASYCAAFVRYRALMIEMQSEPFVTEDGKKNPKITAMVNYSEEVRKYASSLGLTVDSRLKIASMNVQAKQNDIEDMFGDI